MRRSLLPPFPPKGVHLGGNYELDSIRRNFYIPLMGITIIIKESLILLLHMTILKLNQWWTQNSYLGGAENDQFKRSKSKLNWNDLNT